MRVPSRWVVLVAGRRIREVGFDRRGGTCRRCGSYSFQRAGSDRLCGSCLSLQ
jgi:hypothetical protein